MKKTGYWKGFGSALLLVAMVTALGVTATAASRSIEVEDGIGISINGAKFTPRDADGKKVPVFLYNGTTYAPIRAVCEAAGMEVSYDSATDTVELVTADRVASQKPDSSSYITQSRAKKIALADAGVEVYSGNTEYDYDIDALTGAILSSDRELEDFDIGTVSSSSGKVISAEKAKSIALNRAPSGSTVVKCQLDRDDGRTIYEVELRNGRMEYDCDIDAVSGQILKWESDYDD